MNLRDYQVQANRTCAELENYKLDLAHMILGFYSEYNELMSAERNMDLVNYGEELTDFQWYFANYCTMREYNFDNIYETMIENRVSLEELFSKLADHIKKFIAYDKRIDKIDERDLLQQIAYALYEKYRIHQLDMNQCLQNNIDKLQIRFPNKFTKSDALNRDLEAERRELEK